MLPSKDILYQSLNYDIIDFVVYQTHSELHIFLFLFRRVKFLPCFLKVPLRICLNSFNPEIHFLFSAITKYSIFCITWVHKCFSLPTLVSSYFSSTIDYGVTVT